MKPLSHYSGSDLTCVQPSVWKQDYELRAGDEVIGTFRFPSIFSRKAEVTSVEGPWVIEERGIWKKQILVSEMKHGKRIAGFPVRQFGESKIRLTPTRSVRLTMNVWKREITLANDMNFPLVKVKETIGFKGYFDVKVEQRGDTLPELPWLIYVVLFCAVTRRRGRGAK